MNRHMAAMYQGQDRLHDQLLILRCRHRPYMRLYEVGLQRSCYRVSPAGYPDMCHEANKL